MNDQCIESEIMTLRDWFAGQAMVAIFSCEANPMVGTSVEPFASGKHDARLAEVAYKLADAMLTEREKQP